MWSSKMNLPERAGRLLEWWVELLALLWTTTKREWVSAGSPEMSMSWRKHVISHSHVLYRAFTVHNTMDPGSETFGLVFVYYSI